MGGRFQAATGAHDCQDCGAHTYEDAAGSRQCKPCDYECPGGQRHTACGGSNSGSCVACAPGRFRAAVADPNAVYVWGNNPTCDACVPGQYQDTEQQTACKQCNGSTEWQDASGQQSCKTVTICTQTQYETAVPTSTSDRTCVAHTVCDATQFEVSPATTTSDRACATCPPGFKCDGSAVKAACEHPRYQDVSGSTACKTCAPCPSGEIRKECSGTAEGLCVSCDAGHRKVSEFACAVCSPGRFEVDRVACKVCNAGRYSNAGEQGCKSCVYF